VVNADFRSLPREPHNFPAHPEVAVRRKRDKTSAHERQHKIYPTRLLTSHPVSVCEPDLADFLKNAFGAEITHPPTPDAAGQFHSEATIGDAHVLFGNGFFSDPSMAAAIYLYVPDVDATYKRAVSLGAKAIREPANMTWGDRVAGVKDTSGNTWWIATNTK
jgi:PhnB protein